MLEQLTTVFTQVISWMGSFITALTTTEGALYSLLPLMFIGIGVSLLLVACRVVRKIIWGN